MRQPQGQEGRKCARINHDCSKLGKERKCRFRNGLKALHHRKRGRSDPAPSRSTDMEDLVAMGKLLVCPFTIRGPKWKPLSLCWFQQPFVRQGRERSTLAGILG
jgi:hypothetical protein